MHLQELNTLHLQTWQLLSQYMKCVCAVCVCCLLFPHHTLKVTAQKGVQCTVPIFAITCNTLLKLTYNLLKPKKNILGADESAHSEM